MDEMGVKTVQYRAVKLRCSLLHDTVNGIESRMLNKRQRKNLKIIQMYRKLLEVVMKGWDESNLFRTELLTPLLTVR